MLKYEMAVLGKAMEDTDLAESIFAEFTEEHFTSKDCKRLYKAMLETFQDGRIPKAAELMKRYPNGAEVIQEAFTEGLRTLEIDADLKQVRMNYQRIQYRKMTDMLVELMFADGFNPADAAAIIDNFSPKLFETTGERYLVSPEEGAKEALEQLREAMKTPGQVKGISLCYKNDQGATVGFKGLDYAINGVQNGDLIMIGAKSGHGKTALAMNIARIMAYHNKRTVYYLNTEMNIAQMVNRWASMATQIDYGKIERGDVSESDFDRFTEWAVKFGKSPLYISRIPSLSPEMTKALARHFMKKHGHIDCLIVDYVGRMNLEQTKGLQEYQILSQIVKQLKETAMLLDIPIITLAQLNDEGKLEGAKKMRNECDALFFFVPKQEKIETDAGMVTVDSQTDYMIIKEKVRRGSTDGIIHCEFDKPFQFIREL